MAKAKWLLMKTIEQKVLNFIDQNSLIEEGDRVLIALSGGPDSVFALYFLNKYRNRFKISIGAAHVNHGLRGISSDGDEIFCKELSDRIGVQYFVTKINVKKYADGTKISVEEAARVMRYNFLESVSKENSYNKIVTAHNLSDNAETVILNLVKGTGLKGIAGIPIRRENIIRPFLAVSKQEIVNYLNNSDIKYRVDESNLSDIYERNFIRHNIIPAVKKINPSFEDNLLNSSEIFRNTYTILDDYISSIYSKIISFSDKKVKIDLFALKDYKTEILSEILKRCFASYLDQEFSFDDYSKIKSLLNKQTGRKVMLAAGIVVYKERDSLIICKEAEDDPLETKIKVDQKIKICEKVLSIRNVNKENIVFGEKVACEFISGDNIENDEFVVRRWKPGDKFIPLGVKGFKKVSDFLTEQKVPSFEKSEQLVLLNNGNIVWVPGYRIDNRYRIIKNTKKVFELCLK